MFFYVCNYSDQAREVELPILDGEDLHSVVFFKKATCGGLDGWGWNGLIVLPISWYVGPVWVLRTVEDTGQWILL